MESGPQIHSDDLIKQRDKLGLRCFDLELVIAAKDRELKQLREALAAAVPQAVGDAP